MLIVMAGLPGTGKSTLARALAGPLRAVVLDKDRIRPALFPQELIEYSREQDDFVMRVMLQTAGYVLERHPARNIILDGRTFSQRYQREEVRAFAAGREIPCRVVECVCPVEVAEARLQNDSDHPAANRTVGLHRQVRARFQPIEGPKIVVDTERPLAECVARCLEQLGRA